MKSHRLAHLSILILFGCVFTFAGVKSNTRSRSKSQSASQPNGGSAVALGSGGGAKVAPGAGLKSGAFSEFADAASQNAQLQSSVPWSLGGKSQRGWSLYVPLIGNMIGSDADGSSDEFAARVARWQKENGAAANGVLDAGTLSRIVATFQSRRLTDRSYPAPDQLVTIPTSDCYDTTRAEELRRAERETFAAYKRMVAAAAADSSLGLQSSGNGELAPNEKFFKIISAFRSREYQDQLRKQSPNSGRAGLAINSPHATGRALDVYVGGDPVNTKDDNRALQIQTPAYRWLVANAARFGFRPYFYEPWHWEYVGTARGTTE